MKLVNFYYHGAERNGSRGMIVDGDKVDEKGSSADESRQHEGRHQHLPDPHLAAHPGIQGTPKIAIDRGCNGVDEYRGGQERPSSKKK